MYLASYWSLIIIKIALQIIQMQRKVSIYNKRVATFKV